MLRSLLLALTCICVAAPTTVTHAALNPDEIAIIAANGSRESMAVATYYAKIRQIPTENIVPIDFPSTPEISREAWNTTVRPKIRSWLGERERSTKIRCFVTVWDVPLSIAPEKNSEEAQPVLTYYARERSQRVAALVQYITELRRLANDTTSPPANLTGETPLADIQKTLDQAFNAAQAATAKETDKTAREKANQQLQVLYVRAVGMSQLVQSLAKQLQEAKSEANAQFRTEFDFGRGRVIGLREGRVALEGLPFSLEREPQLLAIIQVSEGLLGSIGWLDDMASVLKKNETFAAFDSELALVGWQPYQLARWQPNLLHYRYDDSPMRDFRKTYMVSRIEGPTLKRTRQMIDQAVEVENKGLTGKVYFDARGLAKIDENVPGGGYPDYDQSILRAADLIKKQTDLEVVLDTAQDLFQPGACPDAALYCGWYSLAKYVDAFDWKPGAIAYHMASAEATTLRNADSQVWCKRMLEDGVLATVGPTAEPYITAFPRPNEFFPLVLSGKYTLAEAYYRSQPFSSWTMILVGDPLYNPFKKSSPLRREGLDEVTLRIIDGPNATPPAAAASPKAAAKPSTALEGDGPLPGSP